jgi:hypothetical protein
MNQRGNRFTEGREEREGRLARGRMGVAERFAFRSLFSFFLLRGLCDLLFEIRMNQRGNRFTEGREEREERLARGRMGVAGRFAFRSLLSFSFAAFATFCSKSGWINEEIVLQKVAKNAKDGWSGGDRKKSASLGTRTGEEAGKIGS